MQSYLQKVYYGEMLESQHEQGAGGEVSRQLMSVLEAGVGQKYLRLMHGDAEVMVGQGQEDAAQNHCWFPHGC
jgi:hypothetical protein